MDGFYMFLPPSSLSGVIFPNGGSGVPPTPISHPRWFRLSQLRPTEIPPETRFLLFLLVDFAWSKNFKNVAEQEIHQLEGFYEDMILMPMHDMHIILLQYIQYTHTLYLHIKWFMYLYYMLWGT